MGRKRDNSEFWRRMSKRLDGPIGVISPRRARDRQAQRFAYDVLDQHRLRRKRSTARRGGDQDLSETTLDSLRQIARDLSCNNPLVKGLFRKLATNVVGTSTRIQIKTEDDGWNEQAEAAIKAEMIDSPCDVTGRLNLHALLYKSYYRYAQDGDCFIVLTDDGPQAIQGEQCGTPYGSNVVEAEHYTVTNGVAFSKKTGKLIGYFIGKPNKWGYIQGDSYKRYEPADVHHIVNLERFDHSRGEPMLTSAVSIIDQLFGYIDAELVAAKVNACFPMIAKTFDAKGFSGALGTLMSESGANQQDDYDRNKIKIEPGMMLDASPGEGYEALGATRPSQQFDSFTMRMLMFVGSPMCLPLMLTTGDFSHATFMNARFAYNEARAFWRDEQELVMRQLVRRLILWKLRDLIDRGELADRDDWNKNRIYLKRWPYVDPFREAQANKLLLENDITNRTDIVAAQDGRDWYEEIWKQRVKEEEIIAESGVKIAPQKENDANGGQK